MKKLTYTYITNTYNMLLQRLEHEYMAQMDQEDTVLSDHHLEDKEH